MSATPEEGTSSEANAAYFASRAFLDDAQIPKAVRCTSSGTVVTCGFAHRFYALWILFGMVLGVVPTGILLLTPWGIGALWSAPMVPRVVIVLLILLGWHLLLRGLLSRRTVVFDFAANRATFFKSFPTYSVRAIDLLAVKESNLATEPGFRSAWSSQPPPIGRVITLVLKDGQKIKVLKTLDSQAFDRALKFLAAASQGTLAQRMFSTEQPHAH